MGPGIGLRFLGLVGLLGLRTLWRLGLEVGALDPLELITSRTWATSWIWTR